MSFFNFAEKTVKLTCALCRTLLHTLHRTVLCNLHLNLTCTPRNVTGVPQWSDSLLHHMIFWFGMSLPCLLRKYNHLHAEKTVSRTLTSADIIMSTSALTHRSTKQRGSDQTAAALTCRKNTWREKNKTPILYFYSEFIDDTEKCSSAPKRKWMQKAGSQMFEREKWTESSEKEIWREFLRRNKYVT